ncbi:MAG: hypothetical protein DRJ38_01940 [Thermoprotei archaeon]|nr:MAG: hypothetical protein DRJ38_01940 [Thermoprotei archaeon]
MRRGLRRIRNDRLLAAPYCSLNPILESKLESAQAPKDALTLELELRPRLMLNIFAYTLIVASLILLFAHLLIGIQVWHAQLLIVGAYLLASATVRKLISGSITFIILIVLALLSWV